MCLHVYFIIRTVNDILKSLKSYIIKYMDVKQSYLLPWNIATAKEFNTEDNFFF